MSETCPLSVMIVLVMILLSCCTAVEKIASGESIAVLDLSVRGNAARSDYYSVTHAMDAMGLPYIVTEIVQEALSCNIIIIANAIQENLLTEEERNDLKKFVEHGGKLVATTLRDSELFELFGVNDATESKQRIAITFTKFTDTYPFLKYIDHEMERTISLGNQAYEEIFSTRAYALTTGEAIASFNDGNPAIVLNSFGNGKTFLFGCRFADLILRALTNHDYEAQRAWSNSFEPSVDVIMLLLRGIYEELTTFPIIKHQIPYAYEGALLLTHDLDAQKSFPNALDFMDLEMSYGVASTLNVTTKYFDDDLDSPYYIDENIAILQQLKVNGFDIQSHSVGHFPDFDTLSVGESDVQLTDYHPYHDADGTHNASIFGEVRVSKELLDRDITAQQTTAFRSGHMLFHKELPDVLMESGYLFDSSYAANDVLTNFPYFLMLQSSMQSEVSGILEIPMTLSDRTLTDENISETVEKWLEIIDANTANNAVTNLLIHTTKTEHKLQAQDLLLQEVLKREDVWIGDQTTFGHFWRQRAQITYSVELSTCPELQGTTMIINLHLEQQNLTPGITLMVFDADNLLNTILVKDVSGHYIPRQIIRKGEKIYIILETCNTLQS